MKVRNITGPMLGWGGLVLGAILSSGLMIFVSIERTPTALELTLFQVVTVSFSVLGSIMLGRESARASAIAMVRPLGRSAINRVVTIGEGIRHVGAAIEERREALRKIAAPDVPLAHVEQSLDLLSALVSSQARTAGDAIQDWAELVPERVAELQQMSEETSQ